MSPGDVPPSLERLQARMDEIRKRLSSLDASPSSQPSTRPELPAAEKPSGRGDGFDSQLRAVIEERAAENGVSPQLLRAVIQAESGGHPGARSRRGAVGLMQLMPDTARDLGVDPADASQNVDGGSRYLLEMGKRFRTLDETLAAYNAGPRTVEKYGGVPPYKETQAYIRRVRGLLGEGEPGTTLDDRR